MGICFISGFVASAAPFPSAPASNAAYVYQPRAHILDVKHVRTASAPSMPVGARVPGLNNAAPAETHAGDETFEIRWYANPPGIPPGLLLMLETVAERRSGIRNHVWSAMDKSEGHLRHIFTLPAKDILRDGPTRKWRVRIVWRGHLLATRTSPNWNS